FEGLHPVTKVFLDVIIEQLQQVPGKILHSEHLGKMIGNCDVLRRSCPLDFGSVNKFHQDGEGCGGDARKIVVCQLQEFEQYWCMCSKEASMGGDNGTPLRLCLCLLECLCEIVFQHDS